MNLNSKINSVLQVLSRYFLSIELDSKIKTVSDLCEDYDVSRGTIQNTLSHMKNIGAIEVSSHGKLGTILIKKNIPMLISMSGISFLIGVMPLPYSKLYEGLSTGIIQELNGELNLPVNMSYMRGALKRIELVESGRYDFGIVSKYAALEYMYKHPDTITIGLDFGKKSFVKGHVLILNDKSKNEIENGMRIGIDYDSIDQMNLTFEAVKSKRVELVPLTYTQFLDSLVNQQIDAAIWNMDEINPMIHQFNIVEIVNESIENTSAVMIFNQERQELIKLIQDNLDIEEVLKIQSAVVNGEIQPKY